jgi:nucleoside 2-deoxyribosyltransferase
MTPNDDRPRCYIASPLGFTEGGRHYYQTVYLPALARLVVPVDPWALASPDEVAAAHTVAGQRELALAIGRRNVEAIRSCELLVAYLEGPDIDSGTAAEVGYAAAAGLRCFGLRSDLRESGEAGAIVNLQVETLILDSGGTIAPSLDSLLEDLARIVSPG